MRTDGVVKLSDLGLARIGWGGDGEPGQSRLMGTADFVAPEQAINSATADARADIYALGGMLYVMLTGRKPHDGETLVKLLEQMLSLLRREQITSRVLCHSNV